MICLTLAHKLITADPMQYSTHDWPLGHCGFPAEFHFLSRQAYHCTAAHVAMKLPIHDIYPTPNNLTGFALAFNCAATFRKVHGRLALTNGTCITIDQMRWWNGSGNFKHPDEIINSTAR